MSSDCRPCTPYVIGSSQPDGRGDECAEVPCGPGFKKITKSFEATGISYAFCVPEGDEDCRNFNPEPITSPANPTGKTSLTVVLPVVAAAAAIYIVAKRFYE